MEVAAHGQELTTKFLDQLFVSILYDIPDRKWVEIRKNNDQVIAGIKHIVDMDVYGQNIEIVFNDEFTHFKKRIDDIVVAHPFEGLYLDDTACTRYCGIVAKEEENYKRSIKREQKKIENEQYKNRKRGRKR